EVVFFGFAEEMGNRPAHDGNALVRDFDDRLELPHLGGSQDARQFANIDIGRSEARQARVVVLAVANDESYLTAHKVRGTLSWRSRSLTSIRCFVSPGSANTTTSSRGASSFPRAGCPTPDSLFLDEFVRGECLNGAPGHRFRRQTLARPLHWLRCKGEIQPFVDVNRRRRCAPPSAGGEAVVWRLSSCRQSSVAVISRSRLPTA